MDKNIYPKIKAEQIEGRYITNDTIFAFLQHLPKEFTVETVGESVMKEAIKSVTIGNGSTRIFMWSQMHGNESTTTKAVLDLMNFLQNQHQESKDILKQCTLKIVPILNPDGARAYTRVNANQVDLNRDAQNRSQPESIVLRKMYTDFNPHYCFNLHDQRTIFNVSGSNKPATISFLAPAFDAERNNSASRKRSMQLIAAMNQTLQKMIPGQVGRYDDAFNPNCIGDAFQMENTPTILFEAGHFPEDYQREKTRELIFHALVKVINVICNEDLSNYTLKAYYDIPENNKLFYDVLIKNGNLIENSIGQNKCVGILYKEILEGDTIVFVPYVEKRDVLMNQYLGHKSIDCSKKEDLEWLKAHDILNLVKQNF